MSVTREKDGTYTVQWREVTWEGKVVHRKKRNFKSKKEARDFENRQKSNGPVTEMVLDELIEVYYEYKKNDLKARTIETKKDVTRLHISPYFGNKKIKEITTKDIVCWKNRIIEQGYSDAYLRLINNILVSYFNFACTFYGLPESPAKKIKKMGSYDKHSLNFWTLEEFSKFRSEYEPGSRSYVFFTLLFYTGLREGEALALTPGDIDLDKYRISITKTYYRRHKEDIITKPKTKESIRTITIPEFLAQDLKKYMSTIYGLKNDQRIFDMTAEAVQHTMKNMAKKANVKQIRVHDLRHSHCAYLISLGVDPMVIKERLGHKDIKVTLGTYGHLYPSRQTEVAELLNDKLNEFNEMNNESKGGKTDDRNKGNACS